eukprot:scaffold4948_cov105-Isochrysis_galbana.AAC.1
MAQQDQPVFTPHALRVPQLGRRDRPRGARGSTPVPRPPPAVVHGPAPALSGSPPLLTPRPASTHRPQARKALAGVVAHSRRAGLCARCEIGQIDSARRAERGRLLS